MSEEQPNDSNDDLMARAIARGAHQASNDRQPQVPKSQNQEQFAQLEKEAQRRIAVVDILSSRLKQLHETNDSDLGEPLNKFLSRLIREPENHALTEIATKVEAILSKGYSRLSETDREELKKVLEDSSSS